MNFLMSLVLLAAAGTQPAPKAAVTKPASAPAAQQAQPATPAATEEAKKDQKSWYNHGLLGWYVAGGEFMIALFLCQVVGLAVIIERIGAYRAMRTDISRFRDTVKELLSAGKVDEAVKLCDDTPGPVAATLAVGLRRFKLLVALGKPVDELDAEVEKAIDDYSVHVLAVLERHVPVLASIVALGPLFGFLGTVAGMVEAFGAIEEAAGSGNIIQITAKGIKVALLTTILGLCVGIVTQIFYNLFTAKVNSITLEVEESATDLIQNLTVMTAAGATVDGDRFKAAVPVGVA